MNLQENYRRLFKGRIRSNDSKLLSEANKVEITDHDDDREEMDYDDEYDETTYEGELIFTGTINGMKFTAKKEYLDDGAIFTSVHDEDDNNLEDEEFGNMYDDIMDAINDYMEEEGL